ncbi:hypothetical protein DSLASN_49590 [Desulfoluna limicola]|uniref:Uncharacterized protein n=1 Tax=Desulfoluna limicola TaxID=2810562 RepID=A0ABM7PPN0_9BACT|nr:hypothetical protein DSLASN_49590 [Desulfoluna limicola]
MNVETGNFWKTSGTPNRTRPKPMPPALTKKETTQWGTLKQTTSVAEL